MRNDEDFVPGSISLKIDAASETLFPTQLDNNKSIYQMTQDELFEFMKILLGYPLKKPRHYQLESDDPKNRAFMEFVADEQELGNNGEPLQPEDLDLDEVPFEVARNPSDSECATSRFEECDEDDGLDCYCDAGCPIADGPKYVYVCKMHRK